MKTTILVAAAMLASTATSAIAAQFIDTTTGYATTGTANLYNGASFSYYAIDKTKTKTYGAITGSSWTGHYGAKVSATLKAKFGFSASASFANTVNTALTGNVRTIAGGQTTQGSTFVLSTDFTNAHTTSNIGKGQVDAALTASAYAGANLHAKACVVFCKEGDLVNVGVGVPKDINVLGYHSATNSVTFLDKTYTNQLPQYFSSDTLPLTAKLEAIDVSGTRKGLSSNYYHTEQQFAGAYVDVAKVLVQALGIPSEVVSGSALGFDYTTISAKVGIGINAIYDVATTVLTKVTNYAFSAPVQVFNNTTNKWNAPITSLSVSDGKAFALRTATPLSSLSVLPTVYTYGQSEATLKLNVTAEDHIALLQISGYGISAGPLYTHDDVVELGTLGTFTAKNTFFFKDTTLAPFSLDFSGAAKALAGGDESAATMLSNLSRVTRAGDIAFVFVPTPGAAAPGDTISGTIEKVTNYNTDNCNADTLDGCQFDRSFTAIGTQQRLVRGATGAPSFSYAVDFDTVDRLEELPEGTSGVQATPESLRALLASLPPPGSNGYDLDPYISDNSTPFAATVPEPAEWTMLIGGFGLLGSVARRRRAQAKFAY
ncbi:hypothetical protein SPAN111604_07365 [Sphingomonas antarctica]|uniref:PEPxxWA-CTERM sorting domain-containing protein n=1 Tax=Sphingomonas antarctica TaxID=2040274 RepID=UPI0039E828F6